MLSLAVEIAIARAQIAGAYHALRSAAVGQLAALYAAKLTALSLTLRPHEVAAAADRLKSERDVAIRTETTKWNERQREHMARAIGALLARRRDTLQLRRIHYRSAVLANFGVAQGRSAMVGNVAPRRPSSSRFQTLKKLSLT